MRMISLFANAVILISASAWGETDNCIVVKNWRFEQRVLVASLQNNCQEAIAAVAFTTILATGQTEPMAQIDFAVGMGLPDSMGGSDRRDVGLFRPGSIREVSPVRLIDQLVTGIRIDSVLFESGKKSGDMAALDSTQRCWRGRLAELESLEAELGRLRQKGKDALDGIEYADSRHLLVEEKLRSSTTKEDQDVVSGQAMEVAALRRFIRNLKEGADRKEVDRKEAAALASDYIQSRANAFKKFMASLEKVGMEK